MILDFIYKYLCSFYKLHCDNLPSNFLINKKVINGINLNNSFRRETVCLQKCENNIWNIGIYIDPKILERLSNNKFTIDDLSCAIEGVSHFIYLMDRIEKKQFCTKLELELQAEVDKFIVLSVYKEFNSHEVHEILKKLFEHFKINNDLNSKELERYLDANCLAFSFCRKLEQNLKYLNFEKFKENAQNFFLSDFRTKVRFIHH